MRLIGILSTILLPLAVEVMTAASVIDINYAHATKAFSIRQDNCATIKCNDPDCDGTNNFLPDGRGQCFAGDCVGQPCLSVCPSAQISCNQFGCTALYGGNDTSWTCSAGDYAGCPCAGSCPSNLPYCNDVACNGSSNAVDQTGICGSAELSDCACTNSCEIAPIPCSDDDCIGVNNPNGKLSVCTSGSRLGCPCKSSCPANLACNDPLCQGWNNQDNANASVCTAQTYLGCYCVSQCAAAAAAGQLGLNSCAANGCQGINNLNGSEFCTAGGWMGCSCTSACPATQLACSDAENCAGFEGVCTTGDTPGCACTGDSPSRKRSPTKTIKARETPDPNRYNSIPWAYYVCNPRGDPFGDTRSYTRQQVQRAITAGWTLAMDGRTVQGIGAAGRTYPQPFYLRGPNAANWNIPSRLRPTPGVPSSQNRLLEFPIIRNNRGEFIPFVTGLDQGPDRVVFDGATGAFVGVFTHRGEVNNNFHQAPGHDRDVNIPRLEDFNFGPTIMDTNPLPWFGIAGSGGFPFKRSPTLPPASFPTSYVDCPYNQDGQCYCYDQITQGGWFPRDAAVQAIQQTCAEWNGQTIQSSSVSLSDHLQILTSTKSINTENTVWFIQMDVYDILLVGVSSSVIDEGTCVTALLSAMDNCQTDTVTEKMGGEYIVHLNNVGSQYYIIHPGQGNPPPPASAVEQQDFDT